MSHSRFTATIAFGALLIAALPAFAVPRWVPLPVPKSAAGSSSFSGDAVRGQAVFANCQACHEVGDAAGHRVGPALTGIVGRPAGAFEEYEYSEALGQAGKDGLIWTRDFLDEYLTAPTAFLPEGTMAFTGLASETDRDDLIAYLATLQAPDTAPWLFKNRVRADIPLPGQLPLDR